MMVTPSEELLADLLPPPPLEKKPAAFVGVRAS